MSVDEEKIAQFIKEQVEDARQRILKDIKKEEPKEKIVEKKPYAVCISCGYPYWSKDEFEREEKCPRCENQIGIEIKY